MTKPAAAWRARAAGGLVGLVFGFTLVWSGLTDPAVIRRGLLFEDAYLYVFFVAALATAALGTQILRGLRPRALLTGERVEWSVEPPERRRLGGAVLFGVGWAVAGACPGPVAAQLGQGVAWSAFTAIGLLAGIVLALRGERPARPWSVSAERRGRSEPRSASSETPPRQAG